MKKICKLLMVLLLTGVLFAQLGSNKVSEQLPVTPTDSSWVQGLRVITGVDTTIQNFKLNNLLSYFDVFRNGDDVVIFENNGYIENVYPDTMHYVEVNHKFEGNVIALSDIKTSSVDDNTFLGIGSGGVATGGDNTFIGRSAGFKNSTAGNNTFIGFQSGYSNVTGANNVYLGKWSGFNTKGNFNTFVGYNTGGNITTGSNNVALGYQVSLPSATGSYQFNVANLITGDLSDSTAVFTKNAIGQSIQDNMYIDYNSADSVLYIVAEYNHEYDIIYRFMNTMQNYLYTFDMVTLKANSSNLLCYEDLDTYDVQLLRTGSDDAIGPVYYAVAIGGRSGWTGANHLYDGYKTAKGMGLDIHINGKKLKTDYKGYAEYVTIRVHNEIYNPVILPIEHKVIDEYVNYTIIDNTIGVTLEHDSDSTFVVYNYYGMQLPYYSAETWKDSVYISHSDSAYMCDFDITLKSGVMNTYPNIDKVIYSSADKSKNVMMWMDRSYGMYADSDTYITDNTLNKFIHYGEANHKGYFRLADRYETSGHNSWSWRGAYSFYDMSDNTDNQLISYGTFYRGLKPISYADFKSEGHYEVPTNYVFAGQDMAIGCVDSSVSTNGRVAGANHNHYNTSAYGVIYETIDNKPLPQTIGKMVYKDFATPDNLLLDVAGIWYPFISESTIHSTAQGCVVYDPVGHCIYVKSSGFYNILFTTSMSIATTNKFYLGIEKNGVVGDFSQTINDSRFSDQIVNPNKVQIAYLESGDCLKFVASGENGGDVLTIYGYDFIISKD